MTMLTKMSQEEIEEIWVYGLKKKKIYERYKIII